MKKLFEFRCKECDDVFEVLTEYTKTSICPLCGNEADKIISTPRVSLEGISGAFPGAAMAWERKHKLPQKTEEH